MKHAEAWWSGICIFRGILILGGQISELMFFVLWFDIKSTYILYDTYTYIYIYSVLCISTWRTCMYLFFIWLCEISDCPCSLVPCPFSDRFCVAFHPRLEWVENRQTAHQLLHGMNPLITQIIKKYVPWRDIYSYTYIYIVIHIYI